MKTFDKNLEILKQVQWDEETELSTNVEYYNGEWLTLDHNMFLRQLYEYDLRLKPEPPEPQYRPFMSLEEFAPYADWWFIDNNSIAKRVMSVDKDSNNKAVVYIGGNWFMFTEFCKAFPSMQETLTSEPQPCGVKI